MDQVKQIEFQALLNQANDITLCGWSVGGVRLQDGQWKIVVIFFDRDNRQFAVAFGLEPGAEARALAEELLQLRAKIQAGIADRDNVEFPRGR